MTHKLSRRRFLSASTVSAFSFTYLPRRVWGANERLNVAGIGVGGAGAKDLTNLAEEGCNIVALCDVDDRHAEKSNKQFPKARRYKDFRVMLEKQKDIDAVTVSTPDHIHAPAAVMAMKMRKHVYCQQPLSHSIYEARVMAQTAAECKVVTQMGNQHHATEPVRRAVETIQAGMIGKVTEVYVWTNRPTWPQGVDRPNKIELTPDHLDWDLWLGPAPRRPFNKVYLPFKWRGWWDFGTGALGDMGCDIMDMPYWALKLQHPSSVAAISGGANEESLPNWSTVTYQFPKRGDLPPVKLVWFDGKMGKNQVYPADEVLDGEKPESFSSVLIGEKGKMYFNQSNLNWVVKPGAIKNEFTAPPKSLPRTENVFSEWVKGCTGGPEPLSSFKTSGPFTETVLLGNLAIRVGHEILWDGPKQKATNVPNAAQFIRRKYRQGWTLQAPA